MRRLRSLSETECYVRLYGGWDSTVTLVKIEPRRSRYEPAVSGEDLRREFEARIEARTDELMAELDAAEAAPRPRNRAVTIRHGVATLR